MWTDNPVMDAERYFAEMEDKLSSLPVCDVCGEHIQEEYCYIFNGEIICEQCLVEYFKKETSDLIGVM